MALKRAPQARAGVPFVGEDRGLAEDVLDHLDVWAMSCDRWARSSAAPSSRDRLIQRTVSCHDKQHQVADGAHLARRLRRSGRGAGKAGDRLGLPKARPREWILRSRGQLSRSTPSRSWRRGWLRVVAGTWSAFRTTCMQIADHVRCPTLIANHARLRTSCHARAERRDVAHRRCPTARSSDGNGCRGTTAGTAPAAPAASSPCSAR